MQCQFRIFCHMSFFSKFVFVFVNFFFSFLVMDSDRFEILSVNEDKTHGTFKFYNEDHTLANILR